MLPLGMVAATPLVRDAERDGEQHMLLRSVPWKSYQLLRATLDSPGLQMTYIEGALELMSPGRNHERWKTNIARLLELYCYRRGIDLRGYGSTTFEHEAAARAAEPDECYVIGQEMGEYPDLAIEVIHLSPLLDKLRVYATMKIGEVWVFRDGAFTVWQLVDDAYVTRPTSLILPDLDLALVARLAVREDITQALRELEGSLG